MPTMGLQTILEYLLKIPLYPGITENTVPLISQPQYESDVDLQYILNDIPLQFSHVHKLQFKLLKYKKNVDGIKFTEMVDFKHFPLCVMKYLLLHLTHR